MEDKKLATLIDIAIKREEEAYAFYTDILSKSKDKSVKDTLTFLANEEKKHKEFLVGYKSGKYKMNTLSMDKPVDYKIAEYLNEPEQENVDESNVYLLAAHRERRSHDFYKSLADAHPEGEVKTMLLEMANQEMKHKEKEIGRASCRERV